VLSELITHNLRERRYIMKKIVFILAAVLTLGISVNSYATAVAVGWRTNVSGNVTIPATAPVTPLVIKPSANVYLGWGCDASGTAYVLLSTHSTGSFAYGTSSGDTNIFRLPSSSTVSMSSGTGTITVTLSGGSLPAVPAVNEAALWTGWTASK
jgi:hypothetical protein